MKKLKNLVVFCAIAVAALGVGMHKTTDATRAPHHLERSIDSTFAELKKMPSAVSDYIPLATETDMFGLDAIEVTGANIESAESFSELYIEENGTEENKKDK